MNILIIEDEELAAERLTDLIRVYDPGINILACLDSIQQTVRFLRSHVNTIDLIFLDIQLADGKCFEIFQQFDVLTPVIFTTAYDSYAMEAFEFNSIDYLMKPVAKEKLFRSLDKFARIKPGRTPVMNKELALHFMKGSLAYKKRFVVNSGNRLLFKDLAEIAFFFAQDKSAFLVDLNNSQQYLIDYTLEQLESMLEPTAFFRINRSVIIHIIFIKEVQRYAGNRLRISTVKPAREDMIVSRNRISEFRQWLGGESS